MVLSNKRKEVMKTLEYGLDEVLATYLKPVEEYWQPADLLPDSSKEGFEEELRELRGNAQEMEYDLVAVLIGDTITEEALPTYESWLMDLEGVHQEDNTHWTAWIRQWTAEENRHGDLLHTYLYLCGRVDMKEMQITTHHLIKDGFDIGTGHDPYRNFVYTSFQEMATNISHRRVATLAKKSSNNLLAKICGLVASDEARHAKAYMEFIRRIFEIDPSEMMLAFEDMMKKKIVMPAHFMRESYGAQGELFDHFSDAAQRLGVYTALDYIDILKMLIEEWQIDKISDLNGQAEKARDYLMKLPSRLERISERLPEPGAEYKFKWIAG